MKLAFLPVPFVLAACASAPPREVPTREVLVLDEQSEPVAGARVRISTGLPWRSEILADVTTGLDGRARVPAELPRAPRLEAWSEDPPQRHVAFGDFDPARAAWMAGADPCAIPVQELWVGAVDVPEPHWLAHLRQVTWNGFAPTDERDGLPRPWRRDHPRARWVEGFLNPTQTSAPVDVLVEVFGKRPTVIPLTLTRASAFEAPLLLGPDELEDWPWSQTSLSLRQPDGSVLDPEVRSMLFADAVLRRVTPLAHHEWYALDGPQVSVPTGDYQLRLGVLFSSPNSVPVTLSEDEFTSVTLPVPLTGVRLTLVGIGADGATLKARSGNVETRVVIPTGDTRPTVDLVTPVGEVELLVEFADGHEFFRDTLRVETTPGPPSTVTWNVQR